MSRETTAGNTNSCRESRDIAGAAPPFWMRTALFSNRLASGIVPPALASSSAICWKYRSTPSLELADE